MNADVPVTVLPYIPPKRRSTWMKNYTFYSVAKRIAPAGDKLFAEFTRKKGKA